MDSLKGKKGVMAVDLPRNGLYMKDRVQILGSWKVPLFIDEDRLGKRRRLRVRSLDRPDIEGDVDYADVLIGE